MTDPTPDSISYRYLHDEHGEFIGGSVNVTYLLRARVKESRELRERMGGDE